MHWNHSPSQVLVEGKTLQFQSCKSNSLNSLAVPEPGTLLCSSLSQHKGQALTDFRAVAPVLSLTLRSAITQRCIRISCKNWAVLQSLLSRENLTYLWAVKIQWVILWTFFFVQPGRVSWIQLWELCWASRESLTPNSQSSSSPDGFQQAELY